MTRTSEKSIIPRLGLSIVRAGFGLAAIGLIFLFSLVDVAAAGSTTTLPTPTPAPDLVLANGKPNPFYQTNFASPGYCTEQNFPGYCVKQLVIYNNATVTIYPVLQASVHTVAAKNCAVGDSWLQAAFGDTSHCYAQTFTYHVYINENQGIPPGGFATVDIPFWSKRTPNTNTPGQGGPWSDPDTYIDWWNSARVYIFDDQTALNDGYSKEMGFDIGYAPGTPQVACDTTKPGACATTKAVVSCVSGQLPNNGPSTACLPGTNAIADITPFQLNEYTWADVNLDQGLSTFNVGYNVSNVDQVYMPIAIEPVELVNPATTTIGWAGSILDRVEFTRRLGVFVGLNSTVFPPAPTNWPIYVIETDNMGHLLYPNSGIRVPGANVTFATLAYPTGNLTFPAGGTCVGQKGSLPPCDPATTPGPWTNAPLVDGMITQWKNCTTGQGSCPQSSIYIEQNNTFLNNYKLYVTTCPGLPPAWLANKGTAANPAPNLYAFLQFVYGWVPFNVAPCPNAGGLLPKAPSQILNDYIAVQNNFERYNAQGPFTGQQLFNPYAQLIHAPYSASPPTCPDTSNPACFNPPQKFGLASSAYAYSIDDASSYLNTPGQGLIFAVSGATGLPNPNPYIFVQPFDAKADVGITLGAPSANGAKWTAYSVCQGPSVVPTAQFAADPLRIWVQTNDPLKFPSPCYVKFLDSKGNVYQLVLQRHVANSSSQNYPACQDCWSPWPSSPPPPPPPPPGFNPMDMTCEASTVPGYNNVAPSKWCAQINENSQPSVPSFELSTPPPYSGNN
ncbi:MAG: hypothetical protein WAK01_13195 [Methylocystis sp.]